MAASFSLGLLLPARTQQFTALHSVRLPASRFRQTASCRSQLAAGPTGNGDEKKEREERSREGRGYWWGLVAKKVREVKEGLSPSPKQKGGDWKDLVLMSLSFAVYVYISQKIVCAYCAWISMINHR